MIASAATRVSGFGLADWAVVAAYLAITTVVGAKLSGRQSTIRDFFLGGRKLAWWAVCGSIIATEISAITFIAVPSISYRPGGNLTYLQWGIGAIVARILIGLFFVPKYYREEIYSPYDYMGARLGPRAKTATTLLFFAGGVLGQGARVYVTGIILGVVAGVDLITAIWLIGLFSVGWTLLGGITTVIWTDVVQFVVLVLGAVAALICALMYVPGGIGETVQLAADAGKFKLIDARLDLSIERGLYVGLFAMPFLNLAALGLDQVMAQRMFCCRSREQARLAIIVSSVGQLMAVLMLFVGIALFAYFLHFPPNDAVQEDIRRDAETVLPHFIVNALPIGVRGLIAAAVFAAAISSLDSALAALSQTTVGAFQRPISAVLARLRLIRRPRVSAIRLSKVLVVVWGVALCLVATACIPISRNFDNAVELAFGLVAYTYGPLLGIFLLAILPGKPSDAGLYWAMLIGVLSVFSLNVHDVRIGSAVLPHCIASQDLSNWIVGLALVILLMFAVRKLQDDLPSILLLVGACIFIAFLHTISIGEANPGRCLRPSRLWSFPIGTILTFVVGFFIGRRQVNMNS